MMTQDEIVSAIKKGSKLMRSKGTGTISGVFYMESEGERFNLNSVPVKALIRKGVIEESDKQRKWNDPKEFVLKGR